MYKVEKLKAIDYKKFNEFISDSPYGNFRQSTYWGEIKSMSGWQPLCFVLKKNNKIKGTALVQKRSIPYSPFCLMYCCRGPVVDWLDYDSCKFFFNELAMVVKDHNCICLRMDPEFENSNLSLEEMANEYDLVKIEDKTSQWNRNLYSTRVVLRKSEDELFAQMRRTHRQDLNKSIRAGVKTNYKKNSGDSETFFRLMHGLEGKRHSLIHSRRYYESIYDIIVNNDIGYFLKAEFEGEIISGLIFVVLKDKAWALFIANDYKYRNLMPNKLLLWEAIRIANEIGCKYLDLGSTQGTYEFDPLNDPLDFLKQAYAPEVVIFPGYYDLRGRGYSFFRSAESNLVPFGMSLYYRINRRLKLMREK